MAVVEPSPPGAVAVVFEWPLPTHSVHGPVFANPWAGVCESSPTHGPSLRIRTESATTWAPGVASLERTTLRVPVSIVNRSPSVFQELPAS